MGIAWVSIYFKPPHFEDIFSYKCELIHEESIGHSKLVYAFDKVVHLEPKLLANQIRVNHLVEPHNQEHNAIDRKAEGWEVVEEKPVEMSVECIGGF